MRGALVYLLFSRLKNQIKVLVKSPSKLIFVIVIAGILLLNVIPKGTETEMGALRDTRELSAGVIALFIIMFAVIAKNGFENGASMFRMQDVNLLFPSPVSPQKVLFYGLFQQLGTSLLIGLFLLFQYSWMHNLYGVTFGWLMVMFLLYGLTVFMAQLTAMAIYSFTNANEQKKRVVKAVFYGIFIVYAAGLLLYLMGDPADVLARLLTAVNGTVFMLFPVGGWAADIANGVMTANYAGIAIGALLCAGYVAGIALLIVKGNPDYYEDVLQSTENAHFAMEAKKQGRLGDASLRKVKTGKTGIGRGSGADAFYYKHLLENRRSKTFLLNTQTMIFAIVIIAFSFFVREAGLVAVFAFATYMQIFSVAFGRLSKELMKPFVYIVPEPPFKKLMACIRESFAGSAAEAAIIFIPVGLILGLTPVETLLCIAARFSFSMLFIAANVFVGRVFGTLTSRMLTLLAFILVIIGLCIPGIAAGAMLMMGAAAGFENIGLLLGFIAANIPVAMLVLYLCRNMLQYTELNDA